ncbi:MAG: DegT/DnrJ/EryC1/StrS family aminotransferase [Planctomycetes bacterium]|nr:DegT/DnrJ/EryC1/StrS family aminotransferase [Planctomycetota bacterium]MBL7040514.1 DegT/DnrJ/EryC1/StrS family aminotransferase [Pirellulaceae bacterium]
MKKHFTRRGFIGIAAAGSAAMSWLGARRAPAGFTPEVDKPALLGGRPAHSGGWPRWPVWRESWEPEILQILRSGRWYRGSGGGKVPEFEAAYATLLGAKRCVALASGTTSLITALHVAGVDAGDEVIVSPYTFIATYNAILINKALPVFADTDPATLTMDPTSIESRITDRTSAILPVHIYGMPCDMDPINAIAEKHDLRVVEDACQAWLAEYKGQKCGTLGDMGCFSFQNSKHITSGEGGAITSNSDELADRCYSFHNCGRATPSFPGTGCFTRGSNYRMQHYQASMLLQQMDKFVKETEVRRENADYLSANLKEIPGVTPARLPENSRAVWHLYPLRIDSKQLSGLSRDAFLRALRAEGVPCSGVYHEQYNDGLLDEAINSRGYQRLFSAKRLKEYRDSFQELKGNAEVCTTTVGLSQSLLLAPRSDMDHIIGAIRKIQAHSSMLAKA